MTPEHHQKMMKGLKRYHQRRRLEEQVKEEELRRLDEQNVNKMFASYQTMNALESRIHELESRLSQYEPIYA